MCNMDKINAYYHNIKKDDWMEHILYLAINFATVALVFISVAVYKYYTKKPKGIENSENANEIKEIKDISEFKNYANVDEREVNGRKIYIIEDKNAIEKNMTILYLHGGAYIGGITKRHWNFIYRILRDTKIKIIVPDYPLAPKSTVTDIFAMIEKVYNEYNKDGKLILMGDSAGGALSLALSQKIIKENNLTLPKKLILISPWLDITMKNERIVEKEKEDKVLKKSVLKLAAEMYVGKNNMDNYLVSPLNGEIDGLPPVTIFTGTADMLNPDVYILKEKYENKNNKNLKVYEKENASHNWIIDDINAKEDYEQLLSEILD